MRLAALRGTRIVDRKYDANNDEMDNANGNKMDNNEMKYNDAMHTDNKIILDELIKDNRFATPTSWGVESFYKI